MPVKIDYELATKILFEETKAASSSDLNATATDWKSKTDLLGELCPPRRSATFIAALGTALLAKSTNDKVDAYCLLDRQGGRGAYSARTLVDTVLARHRSELGIDLGANGPNPFNNAPFLNKSSIRDIATARNKEGLECFKKLIAQVERLSSVDARFALRGFIASRKKELLPLVELPPDAGSRLSPREFATAITSFVRADSEEGRRAQACAAGLLDAAYGADRVLIGGIYDPDRRLPGDVTIVDDEGTFLRTFQVRDKVVGHSHAIGTVEKVVLQFKLLDIGVLAVNSSQEQRDFSEAEAWAKTKGAKLSVFPNWETFIQAVRLFATATTDFEGVAYRSILSRSVELGVSPSGVEQWKGLSTSINPSN